MGLSKTQQNIWQRSRQAGSGAQAVVLTDGACAYLVGRAALDLGLERHFPEVPRNLRRLFDEVNLETLVLEHPDPRSLFERLVGLDSDADMYYACLAKLHKSRLKYETILETQSVPTIEQVGPRGLLQYGVLSPRALAALLFWRKWFYDIDNRAGQETGYVFQPIIAHAVGGTTVSAKKSPVKRHQDNNKGREVDCLLDDKAYEIKIRVTIAASGQGRWREELDFPVDCRRSGYTPVLLVLDGTPNPKLAELQAAFRSQNGEAYIGESAWLHLENLAGPTMSRFLENYVRRPIDELVRHVPEVLPELAAKMDRSEERRVGKECRRLCRSRWSPYH
jgi:hypothetical protein